MNITQINNNPQPFNKNLNEVSAQHNIGSTADAIRLCQKYRNQNYQLKYRIRQLENSINIIKYQQSITGIIGRNTGKTTNNVLVQKFVIQQDEKAYLLTTDNNSRSVNKSISQADQVERLQKEYRQYKQNLYEQYKRQIKQASKFVQYLYLCFQEFMQTQDPRIARVIRQVGQKGITVFLNKQDSSHAFNKQNKQDAIKIKNRQSNPKGKDKLQQFIKIIEQQLKGTTVKNNDYKPVNKKDKIKNKGSDKQSDKHGHPQYSFIKSRKYDHPSSCHINCPNQLVLTQFFDQKHSNILLKKIKQLNELLMILINVYKVELTQIKQQSTGSSEYILNQLKLCIVRNCNMIGQPQNNTHNTASDINIHQGLQIVELQCSKTGSSVHYMQPKPFNNNKLRQSFTKNKTQRQQEHNITRNQENGKQNSHKVNRSNSNENKKYQSLNSSSEKIYRNSKPPLPSTSIVKTKQLEKGKDQSHTYTSALASTLNNTCDIKLPSHKIKNINNYIQQYGHALNREKDKQNDRNISNNHIQTNPTPKNSKNKSANGHLNKSYKSSGNKNRNYSNSKHQQAENSMHGSSVTKNRSKTKNIIDKNTKYY